MVNVKSIVSEIEKGLGPEGLKKLKSLENELKEIGDLSHEAGRVLNGNKIGPEKFDKRLQKLKSDPKFKDIVKDVSLDSYFLAGTFTKADYEKILELCKSETFLLYALLWEAYTHYSKDFPTEGAEILNIATAKSVFEKINSQLFSLKLSKLQGAYRESVSAFRDSLAKLLPEDDCGPDMMFPLNKLGWTLSDTMFDGLDFFVNRLYWVCNKVKQAK